MGAKRKPRCRLVFTREDVLARITAAPTRHASLCPSRNPAIRARLRLILDELLAGGHIRVVRIDRQPCYATGDWQMDDDLRLKQIADNCRPVGDCMVWAGHVDKVRGPIVRFSQEPNTSVRRTVWQIRRGKLKALQVVRPGLACEHGCVEYTHLSVGTRDDQRRGQPISPMARITQAKAQQARGKLDWEKVRAIRASEETDTALAERFDVTRSNIRLVRIGKTWREPNGMFTALLNRRAAA